MDEFRAPGMSYLGATGRETMAFVERDILRTAKSLARFGEERLR